MMDVKIQSFGAQILGAALSVIASLVAGVIVWLGRESLVVFGLLVSRSPWLFRFIDKVYLIIVGIVWLLFWLWTQGYMSVGAKKESIWRRFFRVIAVEMILLFAATILMAVYTMNGVNWPLTILAVISLAGGVALLVWLKKRTSGPVEPSEALKQ